MFIDSSIKQFVDETASSSPVPGGGGVSALVGALGISLGNMVGELTLGKKKYAEVEDEIKELMNSACEIKNELLSLIDLDAEAFAPLAKAYGIPKDDPNRDEIMESALREAASVPLKIVRTCGRALDVIQEFAQKGSKLAISDAGCAASLCGAAMKSAALNVYINTKYMKDRDYADSINKELETIIESYAEKSDDIYEKVAAELS